MSTLNQSIKRKKIKHIKNNIFNGSPQTKALIVQLLTMSPKKPNSANRKIAVVKLRNEKKIKAYIPGEKSCLKEHSEILIRGGNTKDLPGIKYKLILNSTNTTFPPSINRINKRSKYGVKLKSDKPKV